MCNYSNAVYSEGQVKGYNEGAENAELANIKSLMKKKGWSAEEAMDVLDINENKRSKYLTELKKDMVTA